MIAVDAFRLDTLVPAVKGHPDLTSPPPELPSVAKTNEEVTKFPTIISEDQLLAGIFILKAFMDEMHFDETDAIFFRRDAKYAWPQGN